MKKLLTLLAVAPLTVTACIDSVETSAKGQSYDEITIANFDRSGNTVYQKFDSVPQRVIAEGQASVDLMAALGLADLVVGSSRADEFDLKPEWGADLDDMNHIDELWQQEAALVLNPDFVIAHTRSAFNDDRLQPVSEWHDLNVGTFILSSQVSYPLSIDKEIDDILNIGRIFNVEDKAQELVDDILETVETAAADLPTDDLNILVYEDLSDPNNEWYKVYGTNTLADSFTSVLGDNFNIMGENMGGKTLEHVSTSYNDADIVITLSNFWQEGKDWVEQDYLDSTINHAALQDITAVQNGNVFYMASENFYAPGVRTGDSIIALKNVIESYVKPDATPAA